MTTSTQQEIDRLHDKLAAIYRLGALTPNEKMEARGLWARIERLEATQVAVQVKEAKASLALREARAKEGME